MAAATYPAKAACGQTRRPRDETAAAAQLPSWLRSRARLREAIRFRRAEEMPGVRGLPSASCYARLEPAPAILGESAMPVPESPEMFRAQRRSQNAPQNGQPA